MKLLLILLLLTTSCAEPEYTYNLDIQITYLDGSKDTIKYESKCPPVLQIKDEVSVLNYCNGVAAAYVKSIKIIKDNNEINRQKEERTRSRVH